MKGNILMKSIEQIEKEIPYGSVYTADEFLEIIIHGGVNEYDGFGFFHDGEQELDDKGVFDLSAWEEDYPYVVWYNK